MKLEEISENEFEALFADENRYFTNGCCFDRNDNLVAFPLYESATGGPDKYYKVVNE